MPSVYALLLIALIPARALLQRVMTGAGHGELLLLAGLFLALVVGVEGFTAVGVKADLGALAVGVLLGAHPKAEEMTKALWSLKELLLIGFFLNIGLANPVTLPALGAAACLLVLVPFKVVLYHGILLRFRLKARTATLASLALANFSEFGLIVAAVGVQNGWIEGFWLVAIALSVSMTFVIASPLNTYGEQLFERFADTLSRWQPPSACPRTRLSGSRRWSFSSSVWGASASAPTRLSSTPFPTASEGSISILL